MKTRKVDVTAGGSVHVSAGFNEAASLKTRKVDVTAAGSVHVSAGFNEAASLKTRKDLVYDPFAGSGIALQ